MSMSKKISLLNKWQKMIKYLNSLQRNMSSIIKINILQLYSANTSISLNGQPFRSYSAHNLPSLPAKGSMINSKIEGTYSSYLLETKISLDPFTENPILPFQKSTEKILIVSSSFLMRIFLKNSLLLLLTTRVNII